MRLRRVRFALRLNHSHRLSDLLTGRGQGIHNNDGAMGIVTDAVRNVTQQELLSSRHARIPDHQDINGFLLSGAYDGQGWVGINDDERVSSLSGDVLHDMRKLILSGSGLVCSAAPNSVLDGCCNRMTWTTNSSAP